MLVRRSLILVIVAGFIVGTAVIPAASSSHGPFDGYRGTQDNWQNRTTVWEEDGSEEQPPNNFKFGEKPGKTNANLTTMVKLGKPLGPENNRDHGHVVALNKSWAFTSILDAGCGADGLKLFMDHPPSQPGYQSRQVQEDQSLLRPALTAPGEGMVNTSWGHSTFVEKYGARLTTNEDWETIKKARTDWPSPEYSEDNPDAIPFNYSNNDEFVVRLTQCMAIPTEPGWYREASFSDHIFPNGSEYRIPDNRTGKLEFTNWFYVCDCESYDEAVQKLGPHPTGMYGCDYNPDATTCTSGSEEEPQPSTATPTAQATATATAMATPTMAPTASRTPAENTAGPTVTTAEQTDRPAATDSTPSATQTGQPGLGLVVATVSVILSGLLIIRRQRR